MTDPPRRIGVMICQCGGNISDYVDTEKVRAEAAKEGMVVSTQVQMFACSDAAQQAVIQEIREKKAGRGRRLLVLPEAAHGDLPGHGPAGRPEPVPSTPRSTFGSNVHGPIPTTDPPRPRRRLKLVRAGVAKTALSTPLERMRVETIPQVLDRSGPASPGSGPPSRFRTSASPSTWSRRPSRPVARSSVGVRSSRTTRTGGR